VQGAHGAQESTSILSCCEIFTLGVRLKIFALRFKSCAALLPLIGSCPSVMACRVDTSNLNVD
jgi:hypothetical protein